MTRAPIVVIGHVDHGKTALVRALSGIETDRLPEEHLRGLSIVPGFAYCETPNGLVDLIDAPGHHDFLRAMLSAAAGAQGALLVVSLAEGVEAQTWEHLRLARMLGIKRFCVALSQCDRLDPEMQARAAARIQSDLLALGDATDGFVICSARTGEGIAEVRQRLGPLTLGASQEVRESVLPIDRAFSVKGQGVVVTGTLLGQPLQVGQMLHLHPKAIEITIRGLQSHGRTCRSVQPGQRVAVNLRGAHLDQIKAGDVLAAPETLSASHRLDIKLEAVGSLKHGQQVRVHVGTGQAVARLRLLGAREFDAGQEGYGQLGFAKPVAAYQCQRAVLRGVSPSETLGAAVIVDPVAREIRSGAEPRRRVLASVEGGSPEAMAHALCAEGRGIARRADLARLQGHRAAPLPVGVEAIDDIWFTTREKAQSCQDDLLARLAAFHRAGPVKLGMPRRQLYPSGHAAPLRDHVLAGLEREGVIRAFGDQVALCDHDPAAHLSDELRARMKEIEGALRRGGLTPPAHQELITSDADTDLLALLLYQRRVVQLRNVALRQTILLHHDTLLQARAVLSALGAKEGAFSTGVARAHLGTSRRIIVPLLEHFDATGVTRRTEDLRTICLPEA